jgi:hypothetical protein
MLISTRDSGILPPGTDVEVPKTRTNREEIPGDTHM